MVIQQQQPNVLFAASPRLRVVTSFILLAAGVLFAGMLCADGNYREAAAIAIVALCAGLLVSAPVSAEAVLITWFATTPLASFYIRIPTDRSLITYNRVVFVLVAVMLLLKLRRTTTELEESAPFTPAQRAGFSVSKFEVAWALLSVLALASAVTASNNVASAVRTAVDTFGLPLVAFHIGRNYFDSRHRGRLLLICGIALAFFLFAAGAFEFASGVDLFPYKGSEIEREGERRVNGPFMADSSYAIVCLILFLFLRAAPRIFRVRFDRTAKVAYTCALAASALGALLPLFRAVGFALVVCWMLFQWWTRKGSRNRGRRGPPVLPHGVAVGTLIVVILIAFGAWAATIVPSTFGRLSDERSAFGRLATWQAAAEIGFENPLFGVGLGNYIEHFDERRYYEDEPIEEVMDTRASNSPHSNVLWVGAELGVAGVALYIAANLYLFSMGWHALKRARDQRQVSAACFLALLVAYWIPGLTLTSGGYSDLNLYFLFLLGALSNLFRYSGQAGSVLSGHDSQRPE